MLKVTSAVAAAAQVGLSAPHFIPTSGSGCSERKTAIVVGVLKPKLTSEPSLKTKVPLSTYANPPRRPAVFELAHNCPLTTTLLDVISIPPPNNAALLALIVF
jgi:hypothetical protein